MQCTLYITVVCFWGKRIKIQKCLIFQNEIAQKLHKKTYFVPAKRKKLDLFDKCNL
jgi:hypothetical protein